MNDLIRLLAILMLMTMPVGMGAPALAAQAHHAGTIGHCDEQSSELAAQIVQMKACAAACAALAAASPPDLAGVVLPKTPAGFSNARPFAEIEPEVVTPPPRQG